jgi:release factor glutamine methyltransferase
MTIHVALAQAGNILQDHHIPTPQLDAEVLLAFVLQWDRTKLLAFDNTVLDATVLTQFNRLIEQRCRRMPVAYLTGTKEFFTHTFVVTPEVLIPRPDTEQLVEIAQSLIAEGRINVVADIGTGSGAIAISLATRFPSLRLYAVDISSAALSVAAQNARNHRVKSRVRFLQGSLCEPLPGRVDLIVANLPYLHPGMFVDPELAFEPQGALEADQEGLAWNIELLQQAKDALEPEGTLILECDPAQLTTLSRRARKYFPYATIEAHADEGGSHRFLQISLRQNPQEHPQKLRRMARRSLRGRPEQSQPTSFRE